jgi:hypothetical protein
MIGPMTDKVILFGLEKEKEDMVMFGPYTIAHFIAGLWLAAVFSVTGLGPIQAFVFASFFHLIYEIKDYIEMYKPDGGNTFYSYATRNSYVNSIGDQISAMLAAAIFLSYYQENIDFATFQGISMILVPLHFVLRYSFQKLEWS